MSKQKMKNVKKENYDFKVHKEKYQSNSDSEQSETEEGSTNEVILYKNLLKEIADTLISIVSTNKKNVTRKENSPFNNKHVPNISIFDYLVRIQKYSGIENSTMIIALIYIDRICSKKHMVLTKYNVHRILFTSILISAKYNEDHIYDNLYYSKVAGVPVSELNSLESKFLEVINYELFVPDVIYKKYNKFLNFNELISNE